MPAWHHGLSLDLEVEPRSPSMLPAEWGAAAPVKKRSPDGYRRDRRIRTLIGMADNAGQRRMTFGLIPAQ